MSRARTRPGRHTYRGEADTGSPRLAGLPGVDRLENDPQQVLEIERHDTEDRRLAGAGIALAVHRDGDQAQWHLELPDGDDRELLRVTIPPDDVAAPPLPAELDELIRAATRKRAVGPVARARIVRATTRLLGSGGDRLGEFAYDAVSLVTFGSATEVTAWTEVELRTEPGAPVKQIERRLIEAGLRSGDRVVAAALDRLLQPVPRAPRGGRPGSAGAALVAYLAEHTERLAAEELRVRRGEPDSVHQLRVASRRLRSALKAYQQLLDRGRVEPLVDGLRDFARELAPARDAEVLHERIQAALAELGPELLLGPVQAQVTRHFARAEAEGGAAVLSALDGEPYARLRADLERLVDDPPVLPRALRQAADEMPRQVARAADRLRRAVETAIDPDQDPETRDLAVHDARKAGKRLRYATEVAVPVVGKRARKFAATLKGFQEALGEHQDTVVAREALRQLAAQASPAGKNGFSFGVLYAQDAARARQIEAQLPDLWSAAWTAKHRRWLE